MKTDLSYRSNAEEFLASLIEFSEDFLKESLNVNTVERGKELWEAAQGQKQDWNNVIERAYEVLTGPIGSVYQTLSPTWARGALSTVRTSLRPMEIRKDRQVDEDRIIHYTDFVVSNQSIAIPLEDGFVHPYCANQRKTKRR